jgi:hypothetical protein
MKSDYRRARVYNDMHATEDGDGARFPAPPVFSNVQRFKTRVHIKPNRPVVKTGYKYKT